MEAKRRKQRRKSLITLPLAHVLHRCRFTHCSGITSPFHPVRSPNSDFPRNSGYAGCKGHPLTFWSTRGLCPSRCGAVSSPGPELCPCGAGSAPHPAPRADRARAGPGLQSASSCGGAERGHRGQVTAHL